MITMSLNTASQTVFHASSYCNIVPVCLLLFSVCLCGSTNVQRKQTFGLSACSIYIYVVLSNQYRFIYNVILLCMSFTYFHFIERLGTFNTCIIILFLFISLNLSSFVNHKMYVLSIISFLYISVNLSFHKR